MQLSHSLTSCTCNLNTQHTLHFLLHTLLHTLHKATFVTLEYTHGHCNSSKLTVAPSFCCFDTASYIAHAIGVHNRLYTSCITQLATKHTARCVIQTAILISATHFHTFSSRWRPFVLTTRFTLLLLIQMLDQLRGSCGICITTLHCYFSTLNF